MLSYSLSVFSDRISIIAKEFGKAMDSSSEKFTISTNSVDVKSESTTTVGVTDFSTTTRASFQGLQQFLNFSQATSFSSLVLGGQNPSVNRPLEFQEGQENI